jgi:hypothetical protein
MPIHDWTRVDHGTFHYFHQAWMIEISYALNAGLLPPEFVAMAEQAVAGPIPDVVTLQHSPRIRGGTGNGRSGAIAIADSAPRAQFVQSADDAVYAGKASRVRIQHRLGRVVAVIEIVSPGKQSNQHGLRSLVAKAEDLLRQGINLLVVDLFPPTPRDPQGIHKEIWDAIKSDPFELPEGKPLTVASYQAAPIIKAYVEPVAVGDVLPPLPIFLDAQTYVRAPLEEAYQTTWSKWPAALQQEVVGGG